MTRTPTPGPYRADFGAIHHEADVGFLFTVTPASAAEEVAQALNVYSASATTPTPQAETLGPAAAFAADVVRDGWRAELDKADQLRHIWRTDDDGEDELVAVVIGDSDDDYDPVPAQRAHLIAGSPEMFEALRPFARAATSAGRNSHNKPDVQREARNIRMSAFDKALQSLKDADSEDVLDLRIIQQRVVAVFEALATQPTVPDGEDDARSRLIQRIEQWDGETEYDAEDIAALADDILHEFNGPPITTPAPALSVDLAEVKAALEPFAAVLVDVGDDEDDHDTYQPMSKANRRVEPIKVGHLRRAAALIAQIERMGGPCENGLHVCGFHPDGKNFLTIANYPAATEEDARALFERAKGELATPPGEEGDFVIDLQIDGSCGEDFWMNRQMLDRLAALATQPKDNPNDR
ncbi:hypothetical protein LTR94_023822 [Friedmanniomyces endolithicus]|nr:hypothetical protein LTR94_023822 [Friedmanniomyces endolithicus]